MRSWAIRSRTSGRPGNSGFALTGGGSYDKFPTAYTEESHSGQWAAKLVTRATGTFGVNLKMPIAAGNLFIGTFDGMSATKDPMKATRFGMTFGREPLRLTGYYRYQSGGDITDENNQLVVPARRDSCNIYAVLYETDDEVECLYGDNVLTSPNLVAVALVDQPEETDVYKKFDVEFEYRKPYDPQKSKEFKYKLAVVFTSSRDGGRLPGRGGQHAVDRRRGGRLSGASGRGAVKSSEYEKKTIYSVGAGLPVRHAFRATQVRISGQGRIQRGRRAGRSRSAEIRENQVL